MCLVESSSSRAPLRLKWLVHTGLSLWRHHAYMATCFPRKGAWTTRQIPVNIGNNYASNVAWVAFLFIHTETAVAEGKLPTVLHWDASLSKPPRTWGLPSTECAMAWPFQAPGAKLWSIPTIGRTGSLHTDDGTSKLSYYKGNNSSIPCHPNMICPNRRHY